MAGTANTIGSFQGGDAQIDNAAGTGLLTLITGKAGVGSRVLQISATSSDTASKTIRLFVNDGTTDFLVTTRDLPIGAGNNSGAAGISLLDNVKMPMLDASPGRGLVLPAGWSLKVGVIAAVTSGRNVFVTAFAGDH